MCGTRTATVPIARNVTSGRVAGIEVARRLLLSLRRHLGGLELGRTARPAEMRLREIVLAWPIVVDFAFGLFGHCSTSLQLLVLSTENGYGARFVPALTNVLCADSRRRARRRSGRRRSARPAASPDCRTGWRASARPA